MKKIEIKGKILVYQLTKSRRKSMAIAVKPDGTVSVKAPFFVSQREIEDYIEKHSDWIFSNIDRFGKRKKEAIRELKNGDIFSILGQDCSLIISEENRKRNSIQFNEMRNEIIIKSVYNATSKTKTAAFESWLRKQAKELIYEKVTYFAQIINVSFGDIRIKDQKSIWASCSAKGNLNFNWRIIMAPEEVIDYLVIHELCHLKHMNHSTDFWQCVAEIKPNYKFNRKWLKDNTFALKRDMFII